MGVQTLHLDRHPVILVDAVVVVGMVQVMLVLHKTILVQINRDFLEELELMVLLILVVEAAVMVLLEKVVKVVLQQEKVETVHLLPSLELL